jgi:hypothetical protein
MSVEEIVFNVAVYRSSIAVNYINTNGDKAQLVVLSVATAKQFSECIIAEDLKSSMIVDIAISTAAYGIHRFDSIEKLKLLLLSDPAINCCESKFL